MASPEASCNCPPDDDQLTVPGAIKGRIQVICGSGLSHDTRRWVRHRQQARNRLPKDNNEVTGANTTQYVLKVPKQRQVQGCTHGLRILQTSQQAYFKPERRTVLSHPESSITDQGSHCHGEALVSSSTR